MPCLNALSIHQYLQAESLTGYSCHRQIKVVILYSGKLRQALNLAKRLSYMVLVKFKFGDLNNCIISRCTCIKGKLACLKLVKKFSICQVKNLTKVPCFIWHVWERTSMYDGCPNHANEIS